MTTVPSRGLPSTEAQSHGFLRLEWRILRTQLAQGFATSRLRYALVIVLSLLLWFGLFHLVREGFSIHEGHAAAARFTRTSCRPFSTSSSSPCS